MNSDNDFFYNEETSFLQYQSLLVDPITKLPTLTGILKNIRKTALDRKLGVFALSINNPSSVESNVGWMVFDRLMKFISGILIDMKLTFLGKDTIIGVDHPRGTGFFIFLPVNEQEATKEETETRIMEFICSKLRESEEFAHISPTLKTGYAILVMDPKIRFERLFYSVIAMAKTESIRGDTYKDKKMLFDLRDLIHKKNVSIEYQPIFDMASGKVFGYEALSRGPEDSVYRSPETMFSYALKFGLTGQLDTLCYMKAVQLSSAVPKDAFIFLNMELESILDNDLLENKFPQCLRKSGKKCKDFIIEITERSIVDNFKILKERIRMLKDLGFRIAVDDGGVGYASLGMISELSPDFIKLDMNLVRNIHKSIIKQDLIEAMVKFAQKQKIQLVAEGIEEEEELDKIKQAGVCLGQGYLLGKPRSL